MENKPLSGASDLTYSVWGNYNTPSKTEFFICLPPPLNNNYYFTQEVFNISYDDGVIRRNALLILFRDDLNQTLLSDNNYIRKSFNINNPTLVGNSASFNPHADETLVVVFHDNEHREEDKAEIARRVPDLFIEVQDHGPYHNVLYPQAVIPRRIGMSIVKKRGS